MNSDQIINNQIDSLQVVSEKILPERIKKVVWNKKIDLIGINCGNYFEIHRIGFKHEEIFKKEENCEVKEILFFDSNDNQNGNNNCLASVILEDTTVYYINCSTCEIVLKTKNKIPGFFRIIQAESLDENLYRGFVKNEKANVNKNPFNHEINFNSFSKIEVACLNFLENYFDFSNCFVYNKPTNQIDFYLKFLIHYGKFKLDKEIKFIKQIGMINRIFLVSTRNSDNDSENTIQCSAINLNPLLSSNWFNSLSNNSFYLIYFSLHVIDYISNILQIFSKIVYKLSIIFFDKYIFVNNLEHELNESNEIYYKDKLNKELKNLLYFGNLSASLKNLLTNELFEGKSIIKMDENIHFNLKNIEEISVENIKPSLDLLGYHLNQIKFNLNKLKFDEEEFSFFEKIEKNFDALFLNFEDFLSNVCSLKMEYRNFLVWVNSFNQGSNETAKNSLSSLVIDNDKLSQFINNRSYDMHAQLGKLESSEVDNKSRSGKHENVIEPVEIENSFYKSACLNDKFLANYIKNKQIDHLFKYVQKETLKDDRKQLSHDKSSSNGSSPVLFKSGLKNKLTELKDQFKILKDITSRKIEKEISLEQILNINLNKYNLKAVKMFHVEEYSLLLFQLEEEYLLVIKLSLPEIFKNTSTSRIQNPGDYSFSYAIVKLKYDNVTILDFEFHKESDLLFLVKTNISNSTFDTNNDYNQSLFKQSVILTKIDNYNFSFLSDDNSLLDLNILKDLNSISHEIKIDKFADIECSENSFLSAGSRGLISVIDNKKNKIIIIDL